MGKRFTESTKLVDKNKVYDVKEALTLIEKMPKAKEPRRSIFYAI